LPYEIKENEQSIRPLLEPILQLRIVPTILRKSHSVIRAKPNPSAIRSFSYAGILAAKSRKGDLMTEMIVAAFDSASAAEAAVQDLERAQIPSAVVRSYTKEDPDYTGYRKREPERKGGFWSWLLGEEPSYTSEYDAYDTSLASGHTVVTVTVDEVHADAAVGILSQHGPREIHEHEHEGGMSGTAQPTYEGPAVAVGQPAVGQDYASAAGTDRADYAAPGVSSSEPAAGKTEEVIPLAEEELRVGKRTVDRGTTTIRRYVVRRPVEEQVTLRDETVSVERRRPVAPGEAGVPAGAFEERTIEVHQTAEEPVVSKTAHIAEEVVVRKDTTERTETVRDDVRREEVEVQNPTRQNP
jgi:uncharacterized protein (TIGR02271 family)